MFAVTMAPNSMTRVLLIWIATVSYLFGIILAEPVQYCKFGYKGKEENGDVDFCMGVAMHQNRSSNAYDMYLSMTVTRGSDHGWTAIGTGAVMAGSLMTIVYGDPLSGEPPIASIRTTAGHHQPKLITKEQAGGAEIRVLRAEWRALDKDGTFTSPSSSSHAYVAEVGLVCYSCNLWPAEGQGSGKISATATSLPWIWAWNEDQEISTLSDDAHLNRHRTRRGNGGWGEFYVDMSRSLTTAESPPPVPSIRPGVHTLGSSDKPIHRSRNSKLFSKGTIHGFLMGISFLVIFPLGVLAMRSQSNKSLKYHWIIQLVASLCTGVGAIIGIIMSRGSFNSPHQVAGLLVSGILGLQAFLGWRHHVIFLRVRHRTWISHAHIWAGRLIMIVGWANFLSGMLLVAIGRFWIILVVALIVGETAGLTFWVWTCNKRKSRKSTRETSDPSMSWQGERDGEYFAVGDDEETEMNELDDHDKPESSPYDPMLPRHGSH
ncbi:hypothetical protein BDV26DRAFT_255822 [Aspergillus bertholletiae]|uniref:Cytochrome b561 domain-containing protein n=1 Tax=Aspergillus bertholletiae TaxID=1226010 RepID=A0A5N7BH83_9EURO|nr:hypothetical protein BDV26DRAFT_255822 [Aspergillus bertholletiae]